MPRPQIAMLCVFHSFNKDIHRRVFIPVKHGATGGTFPLPDIQCQFLYNMAAMRTRFRGRKVPVYFMQLAASFIQSMPKDTDEL